MKKVLTISGCLLIACLCFVVYSCTKRLDNSNGSATVPDNLLKAAQSWHAAQTQTFSTLSIASGKKAYILPPTWKDAKLQQLSNGKTLVVVPGPDVPTDPKSSRGAVRKFVFTTDGDKVIGGKIIELYSSADSIAKNKTTMLENYNDKKMSDFNGVAIVYDINYHYLTSDVYTNGKKVNGIGMVSLMNSANLKAHSTKNKLGSPISTLDDCDYTVLTLYYWYNGYLENWQSWVIGSSCSGTTGDNEGGGGGGGTSGGMGGGISNMEMDLTPQPATTDVLPCVTSVLNSVADQAFYKVTTANIFSDNYNVPQTVGVAEMLNTVMHNPDYGIIFNTGTVANNNNASTPANPTSYPIVTTLNSGYVSAATKLSVARSIIHETIHAYFTYGIQNMTSDPNYANFQTINSLLYDSSGNLITGIAGTTAQHMQMATDYVNGIASMLLQYSYSQGIACPDPNRSMADYCKDMAWGGLWKTQIFLQLPQADQTRILDILTNEEVGAGNVSTPKACP